MSNLDQILESWETKVGSADTILNFESLKHLPIETRLECGRFAAEMIKRIRVVARRVDNSSPKPKYQPTIMDVLSKYQSNQEKKINHLRSKINESTNIDAATNPSAN